MALVMRRPSAGMLVAACLSLSAVGFHARGAEAACPALPADSGLRWNELDNANLVFCKALRESDGAEMFAVVISRASPFRPRRGDREEKGAIDGREIRWYRGQIATDPGLQVRETLLELADGRVAHISLRAASEDELSQRLKLAEGLRFSGPALSSN